MQVLFDKQSDYSRTQEKSSYEWWYFDCKFEHANEIYTLVIIFFIGNPFSPFSFKNPNVYKSSLNISLFKDKQLLSFTLYDSFSNKILNNLKISKNNINISLDGIDNKKEQIKVDLSFKSIENIRNDGFSFGKLKDLWIINSLNYKVDGKIKFKDKNLKVNSYGYHDHNYGKNIYSLYNDIDFWYWGNYSSKDISIVYYYIKEKNSEPEGILFVKEAGKTLYNIKVLPQLIKVKRNICGLKNANKLIFKTDKFNIEVNNLYNQNYKKWIFEGLIYSRAVANYKIEVDKNKYEGNGFTEYFSLGRFNLYIIRFLMKFGFQKANN